MLKSGRGFLFVYSFCCFILFYFLIIKEDTKSLIYQNITGLPQHMKKLFKKGHFLFEKVGLGIVFDLLKGTLA